MREATERLIEDIMNSKQLRAVAREISEKSDDVLLEHLYLILKVGVVANFSAQKMGEVMADMPCDPKLTAEVLAKHAQYKGDPEQYLTSLVSVFLAHHIMGILRPK